MTPPPAPRAPRWGRLSRRAAGPLDVPRARSRVSAYVYGNITVLGALAALDSAMVEHGTAAVVVAVTALATFVAHVLADLAAAGIRAPGDDDPGPEDRRALAHEVRDAAPIASSGALPVLVLVLGWLEVLSPTAAQLVATAAVVVRLSAVSAVVERLSGRRASAATVVAGLVLAAVSVVVAVVKALLGH